MRRPQALHAAALLVDEDEDLLADGSVRGIGQAAQLVGVGSVAGKQDDAAGACLAQQRRLVRRELGTRQSHDERRQHARWLVRPRR